jgi:hypothetical protein
MKRPTERCQRLILISNRNAVRPVSRAKAATPGFGRLSIVAGRRSQGPPKNDLPPAA